MNPNLALPADDATDTLLKRSILISVGLHIMIFLTLFVRTVMYPSEPLTLEEVIKVDIVALPDKNLLKNNLPPAPKAEPEKPIEKLVEKPVEKPAEAKPVLPIAKPPPPKPETPTVNLNKTRKTQEDALKRLEALNKIENMVKNAPPKPAAAAPVKGNAISTGTSLKGIARIEHENYLRTVDSSVKSHWSLPGWMANANLSARVRLFVDARGNIVRKSITRTSHNEMYDARVISAIEAASPLPAPPADLANILAVDGIELEFVPE